MYYTYCNAVRIPGFKSQLTTWVTCGKSFNPYETHFPYSLNWKALGSRGGRQYWGHWGGTTSNPNAWEASKKETSWEAMGQKLHLNLTFQKNHKLRKWSLESCLVSNHKADNQSEKHPFLILQCSFLPSLGTGFNKHYVYGKLAILDWYRVS